MTYPQVIQERTETAFRIVITGRVYMIDPNDLDFNEANIRLETMIRHDKSKQYTVYLVNRYGVVETWSSKDFRRMSARVLQEVGRLTLNGFVIDGSPNWKDYFRMIF